MTTFFFSMCIFSYFFRVKFQIFFIHSFIFLLKFFKQISFSKCSSVVSRSNHHSNFVCVCLLRVWELHIISCFALSVSSIRSMLSNFVICFLQFLSSYLYLIPYIIFCSFFLNFSLVYLHLTPNFGTKYFLSFQLFCLNVMWMSGSHPTRFFLLP